MFKFEFNEIVTVTDPGDEREVALGSNGYIIGRGTQDDGANLYTVEITKYDESYIFEEIQLVSTGKFEPKENTAPVGSLKVAVNKDGKGKVVGYEDYEDPSKNW